MSDCTRWSFQQKIDWFRCQFAQHASLPFSEVLPAQVIVLAVAELCLHCYHGAVYNPVTVVWLFLSQVIHANPTLAVTVESFLAWRLGQGMSPCSSDKATSSLRYRCGAVANRCKLCNYAATCGAPLWAP